MKRVIVILTGAFIMTVLYGCAGTNAAQGTAGSIAKSVQAERTASEQVILDWKDRSIGEVAAPLWLLPAVRGDWNMFKGTWSDTGNKILKIGAAQNARQNVAMTIADVQYAARIANQLKQSVLTKAAISLGSGGEFDVVNDAATKTMVSIAGQERVTEFWQKIETTDDNGQRKIVYNYYVVYACEPSVWDSLVAKYLFDITGQLQDTKTQKVIAGMFKEIDEETKYERAKSEAQFKAETTAQQTALTAANKTGGMSKQEQAAAYKSGDKTKIAAASVTTADTDYVAALAALAN
jgi:hypothetical protein